MTREKSLEMLGLSQSAARDEIEAAYRRLVRRYPPEFQPEKFRQIDEAYRFLTSLPYLLERLLSPGLEKETIDKDLLTFPLFPPSSSSEEALADIKKEFRMAHLWPSSDE